MEISANISILALNNQFYKRFKRLIEKKSKNESISEELEWINTKLIDENRNICENAVNILVEFGRKQDPAFSLNALISSLSRVSNENYDLIADGIFKLLQNINCDFGIIEKAHPAIIFINESSERMLYLSNKIAESFKNR